MKEKTFILWRRRMYYECMLLSCILSSGLDERYAMCLRHFGQIWIRFFLVLWSWHLRRKKITSRFDLKSHPIFSGPYSVNLRPDSQHWSLQRFKHVCIPRRRIIPWLIAGLRYEVLCEDQPVAAADLCYVSHQPAHYLPGLGKGMVPWPREEDKPTKGSRVHFASAIFFIYFPVSLVFSNFYLLLF